MQSVSTSNHSSLAPPTNEDGKSTLFPANNRETVQSLTKAVKSCKQRDVVLKTQKFGYLSHMYVKNYTALTLAVANNQTDVVIELCSHISADEVLETELLPDHTPLHLVKSARIARILVESVPEERRAQFLSHPHGSNGYTAIHLAAYHDYVEVVKYLCELGLGTTLAVSQDTPLHVARSKEVVELLIQSVHDSSREEFLQAKNWRKRTALHEIICRDTMKSPIPECAEIVRLYLHLVSRKQEVLLNKDHNGQTPLYSARTAAVTRYLLESVQEKSEYVKKADAYGRTALHTAQDDQIARLIVECVQDQSTFVGEKDIFCNTALHGAQSREVASVLIGCAHDKSVYVNLKNEDGETALHNVGDPKTAELLIENAADASAYVSATDKSGQTALHNARNNEIARVLITNAEDKPAYIKMIDCNGRTALFYSSRHRPTHHAMLEEVGDREAFLEQRDNRGFTALMYHLERCMWYKDSFKGQLEYIRKYFGENRFKLTLLAEDNWQRNILHLISYASRLDKFECEELSALIEYIEEKDHSCLEAMLVPDFFANTPLHYLAARFQTRVFHDICMSIPLRKRRELMHQKNQNGVRCLSMLHEDESAVQLYMTGVFRNTNYAPFLVHGGRGISERPPTNSACLSNDENLFRVMKYVLNEYLLSRQIYMDVSLFHQSPEMNAGDISLYDALWVHVKVHNCSQRDMQKELYRIDIADNHGKPKVIMVTGYTSTESQYLSPPGPDCIIISVIGDPLLDVLPSPSIGCQDINGFLNQLTQTEGIRYINVNSTLSKHYGPSTNDDSDYTLVNIECRGQALIICNTTGREQWQTEYDYAVEVLGRQLGLQVTTIHNQSASEMEREVERFARSCGQSSLVALAIMSHGDEKGNICGDEGNDVITVQDVVNALCQQQIEHVTKLVFLSFCRGPIGRPRCNRAHKSWENMQLPQIIDLVSHTAVRQGVSSAHLEKVSREHPFPSAVLPLNCYVLFSTLPDSKSFRHNSRTNETNWMFKGLREYLTDFRESFIPADIPTNSMEGIDPPDQGEGHLNRPHVGLTHLFTEVACRVRLDSQATQVLNLCYTIGTEYKPVHLQLSHAAI